MSAEKEPIAQSKEAIEAELQELEERNIAIDELKKTLEERSGKERFNREYRVLKSENEELKRSIASLESAHSAVIELLDTLDKGLEEVKRND